MTHRYTMIDVRAHADEVVALANRVGLNTEGWGVHRGTSRYYLQYRNPGQEHFSQMDLGERAKIACGSLISIKRGMILMHGALNQDSRIQVLKSALLASDRLQEHRSSCATCLNHSRGNAAMWCETYQQLLKRREEGLKLASPQVPPIEGRLTLAISS